MGFLRTAFIVGLIGVAYRLISQVLLKKLPQSGGGYAAPGWRKVADVFRKYIDDGLERGGIFTVYHEGELVVEFWGGYADYEAKVKWDKDTLGIYCSTAKVTGALALAMLSERGMLDYSKVVTEYWPEFGQYGKEKITINQLLSHQAGLAVIDETFSIYDILNEPEKIGRLLASQKPNWNPGDYAGYHGVTMGLIMDQLVRRIDPRHRSLSQFFQEEVAEPFEIDFYIGLPKEENYRISRMHPVELLSLETLMAKDYWNILYEFAANPKSLFVRSVMNPPEMSEDLENHPSYREIPTASSHGFGTGASIAKLLGILANGGEHNGQLLLSSAGIQRLARSEVTTRDVILLRNMTYGPGTMIRTSPVGSTLFGHSGAGGQVGFADPENHVSWSYLTTYHSVYALGDSPKTLELERVLYDCLQNIRNKRT